MSTASKPAISSDCISLTEERWSVRQLTDSGFKINGKKHKFLPDSPLLVLRPCTRCGTKFGFPVAKLKYPKLGRFCSRPCSVKTWAANQPPEFFRANAERTLVPYVKKHGSWNTGQPMRESTREKLSALAQGRGDPFKAGGRGGNGTGMSECEAILAKVLARGWTWNYVIPTGALTKAGWSGIPNHYKPDFAWVDKMVCLEVDGSTHTTRLGQERDIRKTAALEALGWTVLRISNAEVQQRYGTLKSKTRTTTTRKASSSITAPE